MSQCHSSSGRSRSSTHQCRWCSKIICCRPNTNVRFFHGWNLEALGHTTPAPSSFSLSLSAYLVQTVPYTCCILQKSAIGNRYFLFEQFMVCDEGGGGIPRVWVCVQHFTYAEGLALAAHGARKLIPRRWTFACAILDPQLLWTSGR